MMNGNLPRQRRHMYLLICLIIALPLPVGEAAAVADDPPAADIARRLQAGWTRPGPFQIKTVTHDWHDPARDRDVPVRLYVPVAAETNRRDRQRAVQPEAGWPIIIVSHGLGGSRDGYVFLGEHWASHGYVTVHVQHLGSDEAVWRGLSPDEQAAAIQRATTNPLVAIARPLDVTFVLDELTRHNEDETSPWHQQFDLTRIGIAGHSFGSHTALAISGMRMVTPRGHGFDYRDERVRACLAMSSPIPNRRDILDQTFSPVTIPTMHMTGTLDDSPLTNAGAADRRLAFDHGRAEEQYLINFTNADHMVFAGQPRRRGGPHVHLDPTFHRLIMMTSTAFWQAYLLEDQAARHWLREQGMAAALADHAAVEQR